MILFLAVFGFLFDTKSHASFSSVFAL